MKNKLINTILLSLALSTTLQAGNDYKRTLPGQVETPAEIAPIVVPAIVAPPLPVPLTLVEKAEIFGFTTGAVLTLGGVFWIALQIALEDAL